MDDRDAGVGRSAASVDLEVTLLDGELERLSHRLVHLQSGAIALISVTMALAGALVLSIDEYCPPGSTSCSGGTSVWLYALLPVPVILVASFVIYIATNVNLTAQHMNKVERRLAEIGGVSLARDAARGESEDLEVPMMSRLSSVLISRRHPNTGPYRAVFTLIVVGVVIVMLFMPLWVFVQLPAHVQAAMMITYTPFTVILLRALVRAFAPDRGVLKDAAVAHYELEAKSLTPKRRDITNADADGPQESDATFALRKALVPRGPDHVMKVFILPVAMLLGWLAAPDTEIGWPGWSAVGGVGRALFYVVVIECLVYQARYLANDLRGAEEDAKHPHRDARGRAGTLTSPTALRVLFVAILFRAVLWAYVIIWIVEGGERMILFAASLAIVLAALPYEYARSRTNSKLFKSGQPSWTERFIVVWVGTGYAIRAVTGFLLADPDLDWSIGVIVAVAATMWLVEVANVSLNWVSEAASKFSTDGRHYLRVLERKPHIAWLGLRAGLHQPNSCDAPSVPEDSAQEFAADEDGEADLRAKQHQTAAEDPVEGGPTPHDLDHEERFLQRDAGGGGGLVEEERLCHADEAGHHSHQMMALPSPVDELGSSQAGWRVNLRTTAGGAQPWTIAGAASVTAAAVTGALLSTEGNASVQQLLASSAVGLSAGALLLARSVRLRYLCVLGVPLTAALVMSWPETERGTLAPVVVAIAVTFYLATMNVSYETYMSFGSNLASAIRRLSLGVTTGLTRALAGKGTAALILGQPLPDREFSDERATEAEGPPTAERFHLAACRHGWTRDTLIVDVDNCLIAYDGHASEAAEPLARILRVAPSARRILLVSNSDGSGDVLVQQVEELLGEDNSFEVASLYRAWKPYLRRTQAALASIGATQDDVIAVVGDLHVTDGLLAFGLGTAYWHLDLGGAEPRWTSVQRRCGRLLDRFVLRVPPAEVSVASDGLSAASPKP